MKVRSINACSLALLAAVALTTAAGAAAAAGGQVAVQMPPRAASTLQVAGSAGSITVFADHADVLSALKLIFAQAHAQFIPDADVSGTITLRLAAQPLARVLDAVSHEAVLKWDVDPAGVYHIHRDQQAMAALFARIRFQASAAQEAIQVLQTMGYSLGGTAAVRPFYFAPATGGLMGMGGGAGAAAPPGAGPAANASRRAAPGPAQALDAAVAPTSVESLLQRSGLVRIDVPAQQPQPVVDVLRNIASQAGVPLVVDPAMPRDLSFRFSGHMVKPLPEALNLLAEAAHLEWRDLNGVLFVTTQPDFKVALGQSTQARPTGAPARPPAEGATAQSGSAKPWK